MFVIHLFLASISILCIAAQTVSFTGPIALGGLTLANFVAQPVELSSLPNTLYCNTPFIIDPQLYPSGVYINSFQITCKPDVAYPLWSYARMALYQWNTFNSSTAQLLAYTEVNSDISMEWGQEQLLVASSTWISFVYPFTSQSLLTASSDIKYSVCLIPLRAETIYVFNDSIANSSSAMAIDPNSNNNGFPTTFMPSNRTNVATRQMWINVCHANVSTCRPQYVRPSAAGSVVLGDYWQSGNVVEANYASSLPNTLYCGSPFIISPGLYPAGVYLQSFQAVCRSDTGKPLWSYMQASMYQWSSDNSSAGLMAYTEVDATMSMQWDGGDPLVTTSGWLSYVLPFSSQTLLLPSTNQFYSVCFIPLGAETIYTFNDSMSNHSTMAVNINMSLNSVTNGFLPIFVPTNRTGVASRQLWANFCHANVSTCKAAYVLPPAVGPQVLGDYLQPGNVVQPLYMAASANTIYCNSPFQILPSVYPQGIYLNSLESSCRPNQDRPLWAYMRMALYLWQNNTSKNATLLAYTSQTMSIEWGGPDPTLTSSSFITYTQSNLSNIIGFIPANNQHSYSVCFLPLEDQTIYTFNNSLTSKASFAVATNVNGANNGFTAIYTPSNTSGVPDKQVWANINPVTVYTLCVFLQGSQYTVQLSASIIANTVTNGPGVCHQILSAVGTRTFVNLSSSTVNTTNIIGVVAGATDNCLYLDAFPALHSHGITFNLDAVPTYAGIVSTTVQSRLSFDPSYTGMYNEQPSTGGPYATTPIYSSLTWSLSTPNSAPLCPALITTNLTFCLVMGSSYYSVTFSGWIVTTGPFLSIPTDSNNLLPSTQQGLRVTSAGGTRIYREVTTGFSQTTTILNVISVYSVGGNNDNLVFPNNVMALSAGGLAFNMSQNVWLQGHSGNSPYLKIWYQPSTHLYRETNGLSQSDTTPILSTFTIQPQLNNDDIQPICEPLALSPTCIEVLGSSVFVEGSGSELLLTDQCQFSNLSTTQLSSFQPTCRFAPTTVITPGILILGGNLTRNVIINCVVPPLLPVGQYQIQLSLDSGQTFQPLTSTSPLLTVVAKVSNATSIVLNILSLNHTYDNSSDPFPIGWNTGDTIQLSWTTVCAPNVAFLNLLLYVAFFEQNVVSLQSFPAIIYQALDVINLDLPCINGSVVWTIPNLPVMIALSNISRDQVLVLAIHPILLGARLNASTWTPTQLGRRLLSLNMTYNLAALATLAVGTRLAVNPAYISQSGSKSFPIGLDAIGTSIPGLHVNPARVSQSGSNSFPIGLDVIGTSIPGLHVNPAYVVNSGNSGRAPKGGNFQGDVHPTSFDGLHFDFQGIGAYWFLQDIQPMYHNLTRGGRGCSVQAELQPLYYDLIPGSPTAISYTGVTYTSAVGIQADSQCGPVVIRVRSSLSNLTNSWLDIYDNGLLVVVPFIPFSIQTASQFAQPYTLTCSTIMMTSSSTGVVETYNGYSISLSAYLRSSARFSNVDITPPISAFNYTRGVLGSWDGNTTNDLIDQYGYNWRLNYPDNLDAAAFLFGQSWAVAANESFFTSTQPPNFACLNTNSSGIVASGCLFGSSSITNLVVDTNFTQIQSQFSSQSLPSPPSIWPNQTLYQLALQTCFQATGNTNESYVLNQNCLLDIYATNDTTMAIAQQIVATQMAVGSLALPNINISANATAITIVANLNPLSFAIGNGPCNSFLLTPTASNLAPGSSTTRCVILIQVEGNNVIPASQYLPSASIQTNTSSILLTWSVTNLTVSSTYDVSLAMLIYSGSNLPPVMTTWSTSSITTTGCYPTCVLSSLTPCGSDGCGGSCGLCPVSSTCSLTGLTVDASSNVVFNRTDGGPFACHIFSSSSSVIYPSLSSSVTSTHSLISSSLVTPNLLSSSNLGSTMPSYSSISSSVTSSKFSTQPPLIPSSSSPSITSTSSIVVSPSTSSTSTRGMETSFSGSPGTSSSTLTAPPIMSGYTSSDGLISSLSSTTIVHSNSSSSSNSSTPVGPIVGGIVGGIIGLCLLLLLMICGRRYMIHKSPTSTSSSNDTSLQTGPSKVELVPI